MDGTISLRDDLWRQEVKSKKQGLESFFIVLLLCFMRFALVIPESFAIDVTLTWDPSEDAMDGYFLCYKEGSSGDPDNLGTYDTIIKVPINDPHDPNSLADPSKPELRIPGLDETKTYYFVVAAYDVEGYGKGSREVFVLGLDGIPAEYKKDYDRGWGISCGDLEGFTILYSSAEKGVPTFGSSQEVPAFSIAGYGPVGPQLYFSVQPSPASGFIFGIPVTLLIPVPDGYDARKLSIGLYESTWALVWDGESYSQKGGWDWLAAPPVHRSTNPFDPLGSSVIELAVRHFSGIQLAQQTGSGAAGREGGGGGGCFISTITEIR